MASATVAAGPRVAFSPHPTDRDKALLRPDEYLGNRFDAYRAANNRAGVKYDKALRCSVVPVTGIGTAVDELRASGFVVRIEKSLNERLSEVADEMRATAKLALSLAAGAVERARKLGLSLYDFQTEGVGWLAERAKSGALLADQMGLGKTVQALCAIPEGGAALVVAPAPLKGNWDGERAKWRPELSGRIISGLGSFQWPQPGEVIVCNYDILPDDVPPCPWPVTVIADEAHAVKSSKALRTKRFRQISKAARQSGGGVWLLTGTPLLNRPTELFQILAAADLVRESFTGWQEFCRLFNGRRGPWGGYEWGQPLPEVPDRLRRVCLRRKREEVLPDLPTKTYRSITVPISKKSAKELDAIIEELRAAGITIESAQDEAALTQAEGVAFEQVSRVRRILAEAKLPALVDIVEEYEEQGEPLVVFSMHVAPMQALALRDGWRVIAGDVTPEVVKEITDQFQAGKLKGVALTIQKGGVGLTLTKAAHVMFLDRAWTNALNEQAEDRVCRIGQTRGVVVTNLIADHAMDERVAAILARKAGLEKAAVHAASVTKALSGASRIADELASLAGVETLEPTAVPEIAPDEPVQTSMFSAQPTPARKPNGRLEAWAAATVIHVAGMDTDHARVINDMGFSKSDGDIGHSLAEKYVTYGKLTDRQWAVVVKLARKYRRQAPFPEPVE